MTHPPTSEPAGGQSPGPAGDRPRPGGRLLPCLVVVASVYGVVARWGCLVDIPHHNVGVYGIIARNYLKYGYPDLGLAQILSGGPRLPRAEWDRYQNHPPLAPLLSSVGIGLFGVSAWAGRLPHLVCGIGLVLALVVAAARLGGPTAAAWCAIFGATAPLAVHYGGPFPDVMGPALVLWMCLATLFYWRYAATGRPAHCWLALGACVLGCLSDWPAYVLCFVLAAHALWYRTRARRAAALAFPAVALALFALFWCYQRSVPVGSVGSAKLAGAFKNRLLGSGHWTWTAASLRAWAVGLGAKLVTLCSPLVLVAAPWVVGRGWAAARSRANRPDHLVVLLWLGGLGFVAAAPVIFHEHHHYHLLFLPGAAVSFGVVVGRLHAWGARRARVAAGMGALLVCLALVAWSHRALAGRFDEDYYEYHQRQVGWSRDLVRHTAPGSRTAFPGDYTFQMRFVADRAVTGFVDTARKLRALDTSAPGGVSSLYVPVGYPFGDAGLGEGLLEWSVAIAGASGAFCVPAGGAARPLHRRTAVALEGGVVVDELSFAELPGPGGRALLYLGTHVAHLEARGRRKTHWWRVRFVGSDRAARTTVEVRARPSASYLLAAPPGWSLSAGWAELELVRRWDDAREVSRLARAVRLATRVATFGHLGRHRPRTRRFLTPGRRPIVLSSSDAARRRAASRRPAALAGGGPGRSVGSGA